jgi:hypothetical protein
MTIKPGRGIAPGGPVMPDQPWDATSKQPTSSPRWPGRGWSACEEDAGPASPDSGEAEGGFEDGPAPWKQT